jgi:hypothetical protein
MQLTTNLPYGEKEVRKHLESGVVVTMNVPKEADYAFMQELKRTDPKRYARLEKSTRVAALSTEARCKQCRLVLPNDVRKDALYCDSACKKAFQRSKAA